MDEEKSSKIIQSIIEKTKPKETKWDRIRKKHLNNVTVSSKMVKKLFNMNFVDDDQMKLLNGVGPEKNRLNPILVMDVRHEMVKS